MCKMCLKKRDNSRDNIINHAINTPSKRAKQKDRTCYGENFSANAKDKTLTFTINSGRNNGVSKAGDG